MVSRGVLVIALLTLVAADATRPVFGPPRLVATATGVGGVTEQEIGDVNGDGVSDLVVTRIAFPIAHSTFPVGVFLGDGRGGYRDGSSLFTGPTPRTQHGRQIVIADLNGDRRNDIFVADHGFDGPPFPGFPNTLVLSTPDGKLVDASANLPPSSGFSHSAAAADVDRDGDVDLYVGNICCGDGTPPELLLNDGSGRFARAAGRLPVPDGNRYTRSLFVDANGDGAPDLVLGADNMTRSSAVLLNDGAGDFRSVPNALPPKEFGPTGILISLATLDANRDGRADLIAGFQRADFTGRRIQVLIGNGDGTFRDETAARLPTQSEGAHWPYAIRVADLNGDGRADFGVALSQSAQPERPALYVDDGTGTFRMTIAQRTGPVFSFVDANRDDRPDILSSQSGETERHELQLQLQLAPPPKPGRVTATVVGSTIRVAWRASAGDERYEVWRASRGAPRRLVGRAFDTSFTDRRVRTGVLYSYWVRAANAIGKSGFAGPARARRR